MSSQDVRLGALAAKGDALGLQLALKAGAYCDGESSYALRLAAESGHAKCVELLIPLSDPLACDSWALKEAALAGHAACVRLLIPVSDPMAQDGWALRRAARAGHAGCVALLLPVSELKVALEAARNARERGALEVAGVIESFVEARALSAVLSSKCRAKPAASL